MYKSDNSVITTPLTDIDSLVHATIVPVNLTLLEIKNIKNTTALCEARITSKGEGTLGQFGFCWSTSSNPTISANNVNGIWKDSINFSNTIYSLTKNTKYYVRAYAYNEFGISYSNQIEFTTLNKEDSLLESVKIGTQIWTTKNLDVSTYLNGDTIRHARTPEEWQDAASKGEGAWCFYNHDPKNGEIYGKLYNWFCVKDSRGLAPSGYHIPSDNEWTEILQFVGGENIAGHKLKSKTGWIAMGGGDNSSNFTALPGGKIDDNGISNGVYGQGCWWSSSEKDSNNSNILSIFNFSAVTRDYFSKGCGLSVRCIRN